MSNKLLAANWKMKGSLSLCQEYPAEFTPISDALSGKVDILVCPPAPFLGWLAQALEGAGLGQVHTGAQDVSHFAQPAAHTGELHPSVLKEIGASHAIIGHSERRQMGEDNHVIGQKLANCLANGIVPVLCVGESAEQRRSGASESIIAEQLNECFMACKDLDLSSIEALIAYEPFWAIGSGEAATPDVIEAMHSFIRRHCQDGLGLGSGAVRILYGGSVNRGNVAEIAAIDNVDGGLIGGASLDAAHFAELATAFAEA